MEPHEEEKREPPSRSSAPAEWPGIPGRSDEGKDEGEGQGEGKPREASVTEAQRELERSMPSHR
jgi:hypothetical protein